MLHPLYTNPQKECSKDWGRVRETSKKAEFEVTCGVVCWSKFLMQFWRHGSRETYIPANNLAERRMASRNIPTNSFADQPRTTKTQKTTDNVNLLEKVLSRRWAISLVLGQLRDVEVSSLGCIVAFVLVIHWPIHHLAFICLQVGVAAWSRHRPSLSTITADCRSHKQFAENGCGQLLETSAVGKHWGTVENGCCEALEMDTADCSNTDTVNQRLEPDTVNQR